MTVADQIRAKLFAQADRWVSGYRNRHLGIGIKRAVTAYELSDLGACHDAIRAILDLPIHRHCGIDCPTVAAIADKLLPPETEPK